MPQSVQDLEAWLSKIRQAKIQQEVFQLLDEFRPLPWSDEQRAVAAKLYMRILDKLGQTAGTSSAKPGKASDGPVWYEKM